MSEVADRYAVVAAGFADRIAGCPDSQWSAPSPCTDWTARDVAVHVVKTNRAVVARLSDTEPDPVADDEDIAAAFRQASEAVASALADPELATQTVGGMFGDQTLESLVGRLVCGDTLVHTWDFARATGQDERLDPGAVSAAAGFLAPIDDQIRRPGGFGPKLDPPPGADEQTAFLCFCGRLP